VRKSYVFAAMLVSILASGPAWCDGTKFRENVISEQAVMTASARLYSDMLIRACINGHRYSRSRIERGFKRHASEMKLQLSEQGVSIASEAAATPPLNLPMTAPVAQPEPSERRFGCYRRYWLEDSSHP